MFTYHLTPDYILYKMSMQQVMLYFDWSRWRSGATKEKPSEKFRGAIQGSRIKLADKIRADING